MLSCFLDLLSKNGLHSGVAPAVFLSEVREVLPPPPSPSGASPAANTSQEDKDLETNQTETGEGVDMTRTFTSIPRSTFWIPADENDTEKNEASSEKKSEESSSNGTTFYIDLRNLESLASGNCSLCGKSLPEGKSPGRRDSIESNPEKELCKSCQPRRRSSEDVFWIPFTDKWKASTLKNLNNVENGDECSTKTNGRKKSNDRNPEMCKLPNTTNTQTGNQAQSEQPDVTSVVESDNKAVALANTSSEASVPSPPRLRSVPSDMTGFDVSCVCDNATGVCSCTIVKKDLFSTPPTDEESADSNTNCPSNSSTNDTIQRTAVDVVKTVGDSSSVIESTLVARPGNISVASSHPGSPSVSKSKARKENEIILRSFSEADVHNPATLDNTSSSKAPQSNGELKDNGTSEARQGTELPLTQEASNVADEEGLAPDPSPPKQAWATPTPRSEETSSSRVRIVNPFPSPLPPEDKSAVHPPIGPAGNARIGNRKETTGKKGKKGGTKPSGNSKNNKPRTKVKGQEQNGKGGKKKGKGKKKGDMKMITVQQREAGEELGLRTISQGGFEMPEDMPVPPTLSMDYLSTFRPFNARMMKGKHAILSPIPESPRSTASTPRGADVPGRIKENDAEIQEGGATGIAEVRATEEGVTGNYEGVAVDTGEFDVVDGRMIDKLKVLGMCVPRLTFGKSKTESDSGSETECSEPLLRQPQGCTVEPRPPVERNYASDAVDRPEGREYQQVVQDEADDAMEEVVHRELNLREEREASIAQIDQRSDSQSRTSADDSFTNVTSHVSSSLSQTSEHSVLSYQYSRDLALELSESNFVTTGEEAEQLSVGSRTSSEMSSQSEQYSDTDSSYNSCGSDSPRPLSPDSSLNSSDTYFSSPRDSSCADTPTPDRDTGSENSVEIDYYERMAREKSGISSSSSNSSTIRTQSNASLGSVGNISQGSVGSFSSVASENVVRSRLSASSGSQSSAASCEEEIVWKKGNVLGRGAFGTVSTLDRCVSPFYHFFSPKELFSEDL